MSVEKVRRFGANNNVFFTWFNGVVCKYGNIVDLYMCLWCNGYRRRKWTRRHQFKSWTRLVAFLKALIPLGKVGIQSFSLQLWVNSRADCVFQPWWGNYLRRRNNLNVPYPTRAEGLVNVYICGCPIRIVQ